jgi:hypothetical protein
MGLLHRASRFQAPEASLPDRYHFDRIGHPSPWFYPPKIDPYFDSVSGPPCLLSFLPHSLLVLSVSWSSPQLWFGVLRPIPSLHANLSSKEPKLDEPWSFGRIYDRVPYHRISLLRSLQARVVAAAQFQSIEWLVAVSLCFQA